MSRAPAKPAVTLTKQAADKGRSPANGQGRRAKPLQEPRPTVTQPRKQPIVAKGQLHPRNPHQGRYDFTLLCQASPALQCFVLSGPKGATIDFADAAAVKALNQALLAQFYAIRDWDIPDGYLCPPIPGRADYVHSLADLLASCHRGKVPTGADITVLDVGIGANAIYPIIGHHAYGWSFIGADIDAGALQSVAAICAANPSLAAALQCRRQPDAQQIFGNIIQPGEIIDLTLCNPPFHASADEAQAGSVRKLRNLNSQKPRNQQQANLDRASLNFGGRTNELWCDGGELAFIRRMIRDSQRFGAQVFWFTTLVSKGENVAPIRKALQAAKAVDVRVIEMTQGQKISRLVAWTYQPLAQQQAWSQFRWRR